MSVMEFILVAHSILTGLGIAEILRGFGDMIRGRPVTVSRRLLGIASWALLLYLEIWWAIWRIGERASWSFPEFLLMLLPPLILYLIARVAFPEKVDGADLDAYYARVSPILWLMVGAVYFGAAAFQPILYGRVVPPLLASQLGLAVAALIAMRVRNAPYQFLIIALMIAQVTWRGLVLTIGN